MGDVVPHVLGEVCACGIVRGPLELEGHVVRGRPLPDLLDRDIALQLVDEGHVRGVHRVEVSEGLYALAGKLTVGINLHSSVEVAVAEVDDGDEDILNAGVAIEVGGCRARLLDGVDEARILDALGDDLALEVGRHVAVVAVAKRLVCRQAHDVVAIRGAIRADGQEHVLKAKLEGRSILDRELLILVGLVGRAGLRHVQSHLVPVAHRAVNDQMRVAKRHEGELKLVILVEAAAHNVLVDVDRLRASRVVVVGVDRRVLRAGIDGAHARLVVGHLNDQLVGVVLAHAHVHGVRRHVVGHALVDVGIARILGRAHVNLVNTVRQDARSAQTRKFVPGVGVPVVVDKDLRHAVEEVALHVAGLLVVDEVLELVGDVVEAREALKAAVLVDDDGGGVVLGDCHGAAVVRHGNGAYDRRVAADAALRDGAVCRVVGDGLARGLEHEGICLVVEPDAAKQLLDGSDAGRVRGHGLVLNRERLALRTQDLLRAGAAVQDVGGLVGIGACGLAHAIDVVLARELARGVALHERLILEGEGCAGRRIGDVRDLEEVRLDRLPVIGVGKGRAHLGLARGVIHGIAPKGNRHVVGGVGGLVVLVNPDLGHRDVDGEGVLEEDRIGPRIIFTRGIDTRGREALIVFGHHEDLHGIGRDEAGGVAPVAHHGEALAVALVGDNDLHVVHVRVEGEALAHRRALPIHGNGAVLAQLVNEGAGGRPAVCGLRQIGELEVDRRGVLVLGVAARLICGAHVLAVCALLHEVAVGIGLADGSRRSPLGIRAAFTIGARAHDGAREIGPREVEEVAIRVVAPNDLLDDVGRDEDLGVVDIDVVRDLGALGGIVPAADRRDGACAVVDGGHREFVDTLVGRLLDAVDLIRIHVVVVDDRVVVGNAVDGLSGKRQAVLVDLEDVVDVLIGVCTARTCDNDGLEVHRVTGGAHLVVAGDCGSDWRHGAIACLRHGHVNYGKLKRMLLIAHVLAAHGHDHEAELIVVGPVAATQVFDHVDLHATGCRVVVDIGYHKRGILARREVAARGCLKNAIGIGVVRSVVLRHVLEGVRLRCVTRVKVELVDREEVLRAVDGLPRGACVGRGIPARDKLCRRVGRAIELELNVGDSAVDPVLGHGDVLNVAGLVGDGNRLRLCRGVAVELDGLILAVARGIAGDGLLDHLVGDLGTVLINGQARPSGGGRNLAVGRCAGNRDDLVLNARTHGGATASHLLVEVEGQACRAEALGVVLVAPNLVDGQAVGYGLVRVRDREQARAARAERGGGAGQRLGVAVGHIGVKLVHRVADGCACGVVDGEVLEGLGPGARAGERDILGPDGRAANRGLGPAACRLCGGRHREGNALRTQAVLVVAVAPELGEAERARLLLVGVGEAGRGRLARHREAHGGGLRRCAIRARGRCGADVVVARGARVASLAELDLRAIGHVRKRPGIDAGVGNMRRIRRLERLGGGALRSACGDRGIGGLNLKARRDGPIGQRVAALVLEGLGHGYRVCLDAVLDRERLGGGNVALARRKGQVEGVALVEGEGTRGIQQLNMDAAFVLGHADGIACGAGRLVARRRRLGEGVGAHLGEAEVGLAKGVGCLGRGGGSAVGAGKREGHALHERAIVGGVDLPDREVGVQRFNNLARGVGDGEACVCIAGDLVGVAVGLVKLVNRVGYLARHASHDFVRGQVRPGVGPVAARAHGNRGAVGRTVLIELEAHDLRAVVACRRRPAVHAVGREAGIVPDLGGRDRAGLGRVAVRDREAVRGVARGLGGVAVDGILADSVVNRLLVLVSGQVAPRPREAVGLGLGAGDADRGAVDLGRGCANCLVEAQGHVAAQVVLVVRVVPDLGDGNLGDGRRARVGDGEAVGGVTRDHARVAGQSLFGHAVGDCLAVVVNGQVIPGNA